MKNIIFLFFISIFFIQTLLSANTPYHDNNQSKEHVSIQLKWKHAFQFAGYYAAIEKGFYADEGLDVTLKDIKMSRDYVQDVLDGYSEYGVSDSSLILHHYDKALIVLVAQVFQHSPLVLISHRDSNIITPDDLVGKKITYSLHKSGGASLNAMILKTVGNFDDMDISQFTNYADFINKKIDVTSAYSTSQPYWLKKQGIDLNIIDPKSYGIDFYGDNFFTTEKELKNHPQRVAKMKKASLKGWEYALSHQEEIIDLIIKKYAPKLTKDFLTYEARTTYQMIMPDLIDLGKVDKQKYKRIAKTYKQLGTIKDDYLSDDFFYSNNQNSIGLTPQEQEWIKQNPTITVGGGPDWAPFDFVNSQGKYNGIAKDYLDLISAKTGLKFNVVVDKWSNNLQKMQENKIDLLHAVYFSDERAKYMHFTKPYFEMLDYFFIRDDLKVKTLKDLEGKRVAMPKGYAHENILKKEFPNIMIVTVDTFSDAIEAVLENRADMLFDTYTSLSYVLKKSGISTIVPFKAYRGNHTVKLHMATHKSNPTLASILDKGLLAITDEEKKKIYEKWLGQRPPERIKLTKDEREWLAQNPSISFAGDPNWLPFEAFNKKGEYTGITADYLKKLEKLLPLEFKPKQTSTWMQTLELAKKGQADVLSDTIDSPSAREHYMPITPYINTPIVIVMRDTYGFINNLEDISDKKIALVQGYGYVNSIKKSYPKQHFFTAENADALLEQLSTGKIDAAILSMPKAGYLIRSKGYNHLKIVGKTTVELDLTLFVLKSKPKLHALLERAMGSLSATEHAELIKGWQKVEFAKKIDYTLLFQIAGLLGFFLLGTLYWNRKLSFEIKKRKEVESALENAKEAAEHANLAKSEFLANMSHEIRTPMNSVMGFSELLAKQITDPVQKDYLDSIQRGGNTLLNIINDILDLSKIEAGKLEMVQESVDIKQLALEMESLFSVKLIQKNIHFELDIDPSLPKYLLLENTRVRQILFNLIGNAIKFTHHGSVKLGVKKLFEDKEKSKIDLQIYVQDSGIGIEKENIEHIFDAFEQQKGQDNHKYGGTGLGLAISKKLSMMMNGTITVESEVGIGSTFTITLSGVPISSIEANSPQNRKTLGNVHFNKATILVVDDIKDNRKLVISTMNEYNLEAVEAENGKEAIELLLNVKIDLIFMDIKMPVMDGYTATKIIKNDAKLQNIPLIALTASVMGEDLEKIKEYQFDGYLRKPVSQEDLVTQMAIFLAHDIIELSTDNTDDIDTNAYKNLPKVIQVLETTYHDRWEEIKDMGDFTLISDFGESLETLGNENGINLLSDYAKELKNNCESFDIDKIDFLMNSYSSLIEKLRGKINA